jgi:hypothetical protein
MIDFKAMREKIKQVHRLKRASQRKWEAVTRMSPVISDMPKGGGNGKATENNIVEMVTVKEEYNAARAELDEMKRALRRKMKRLKKWQHIAVIRKRYLEEKSLAEVMSEIGYEESQTKRFLRTAEDIINGL